jgi:LPXTG-motif cell wall-anchored protein
MLLAPGLAVASLLAVPAVSGATSPPAQCVITESMVESTCTVVPVVAGTSSELSPTTALPFTGSPASTAPVGVRHAALAGASSLPFTGADVEQLAVVGAGAVLAGGLLIRRRRRSAS